MKAREWLLMPGKREIFNHSTACIVREVLPDHVMISREEFWGACKRIMNEAAPDHEFSLVDLEEMLFDGHLASDAKRRE